MKYIAFIVLGLVLVAAIAGVVLWANMPTAKLTVHAVRPMGTNFTATNSVFNQLGWPVWEVEITNSGRATAIWHAMVPLKAGDGVVYREPPGASQAPMGTLNPGDHTNFFTQVPPDGYVVWAAGVTYDTQWSPLEKTLSSWLKPVPKLRGLLPNAGSRVARDVWHPLTNAWHPPTNVPTAL
jgi:hypothetical protein